MKHILILFILILFIGCGSADSAGKENNISNNIISEPQNIEDDNISEINKTDNNSNENNNNTETDIKEDKNISIDEIKDYLSSEYQFSSIENSDKTSIQNYLNHNADYSISPLINKRELKNSDIRIFYDKNKSIDIPKKNIYVIENGEDSQIFITFNANKSTDIISNSKTLLFYHNTLKIPTGFLNIDTTSTTKDSLINNIENSFSQIGVNNLRVEKDKIKYETATKNSGKVFQCSDNNLSDEIITLYLDSNGSTTLDFPISSDMNITCKLQENNSSDTIYLSSILKEMQDDFNITNNLNLSNNNAENNNAENNNAENNNIENNNIENNNTFIEDYSSIGNNNNSELYATTITLKERPDNSISLQATVTVDIQNHLIPSNNLRFTGIIVENGSNPKYKTHKFSSTKSYTGTGIKTFKFENIPVNQADERKFTFSLKIENIENGKSIIKNTKILVRVEGRFYGQNTGEDTKTFTAKNIILDKNDNNYWNESLNKNIGKYDLKLTIAINRIGRYSFKVLLFLNGVQKYSTEEQIKEINGKNVKKYFKEEFSLEDIEASNILYNSKLIITDIDSNKSVTIESNRYL